MTQPCGDLSIAYTIQAVDVVIDASGSVTRSGTIANLARTLGYPESFITMAIESGDMSWESQLTPGRVICLPHPDLLAEFETESTSPETTSSSEEETMENEYEETERLYQSTTVPRYLFHTKEDFLRYLWVAEFGRNLEDFDSTEAQSTLDNLIRAELNNLRRDVEQLQLTVQGNQSVEKLFQDDPELVEAWLASLSNEELLELYRRAPIAVRESAFGNITFGHFNEANYEDFDEYTDIWMTAQGIEDGVINPDVMMAGYQPDLAVQDFMDNQAISSNDLIRMMAEMLYLEAINADNVNIAAASSANETDSERNQYLSGFDPSASYEANITAIEAALSAELGGNFTYEDVVNFSAELAAGYEERFVSETSQEIAQNATAYYSNQALDDMRAIAFDPNWNESLDSALLSQLLTAIDSTPATVLGMDVSWATNIFRQYYDSMLAQHQWRVELKNSMIEIELAMLERQEDGNSLWWVGFLGEVVLGTLFEPLDWVFTLRDLASGNPYALLGFLPFVPSAAGKLAKAMRYMDNIPESLVNVARYADDFMSTTDDMLLPYADDSWAAIQRDGAWYQTFEGVPTSEIPFLTSSKSGVLPTGVAFYDTPVGQLIETDDFDDWVELVENLGPGVSVSYVDSEGAVAVILNSPGATAGVVRTQGGIVVHIDAGTTRIGLQHEAIHVQQQIRISNAASASNIDMLSTFPEGSMEATYLEHFMELEPRQFELLLGQSEGFTDVAMLQIEGVFLNSRNIVLSDNFSRMYRTNADFRTIIDAVAVTYELNPVLRATVESL